MARLHEYEGKRLLRAAGFTVPRGEVADSPTRAEAVAREIGCPCVVKIQSWTTGRAAIGGIAFAESPEQAAEHAKRMLALRVGNFPVSHVLLEEKIAIAREMFLSLAVDDRERCPVVLISLVGGSGIEERAAAVHRILCDVETGPDVVSLRKALDQSGLSSDARHGVQSIVQKMFTFARDNDARSVEVNPLALTTDGKLVVADCRITIDDYAVFRHPEMGIEIARELDHPPTELERIAYRIEQEDHRGTFFFAQLATVAAPGSKGLVGFHGAGGGGSMMSMDAITNEGFTIANFTDTSGNPSPAKVYRAARIILTQPRLIGYFGSGSGVASQEQYWSAYGLAKAFWEMNLDIPAVIRLGGNTEDRAVEILQSVCKDIPAKVEGFRKTDPPAKIAARFAALVAEAKGRTWTPRPPRRPAFTNPVKLELKSGRVWIDLASWKNNAAAIVARSSGLLKDDAGKPAMAVKPEEFAAKDSDMIACEVECRRDGVEGLFVELDIAGL